MHWKLTGDGPVYLQIMAVIRGAVLSGHFAPGEKIPPVRELAAEARVNPNTMQRALWELEREGILISHGTIGRVVTEDSRILERLRQQELEKVARECLDRFKTLGIGAQEAGALMLRLGESEEKP